MLKKILIPCIVAVVFVQLIVTGCSKKNPTGSAVAGPGTISGIVTKYCDTTVIYGVAISTTPASSLVSTNADGRYTISNVSAGNYTVTASKSGYRNNNKTVTVISDQTTTVDFALEVVSTTIEWISIPAGNFTMGSTAADTITWPYSGRDEYPQHTVYLDAYQISKYEVTNDQYKTFMDSGGYSNSDYWTADGWAWRITNNKTQPIWWGTGEFNSGPSFPYHPVVGVCWYEAYAFCNWAGGHLPTEAQWEKAARGTDARYYPWGSIWNGGQCNSIYNIAPDTFTYSSPVGFISAGQSPYGVYDMTGNVGEWVYDWYDELYYSTSPGSNPTGPATGDGRILRGGGCSSDSNSCRTSRRDTGVSGWKSDGRDIGFRVAR